MEIKLKIEGLNCANCARALEVELNKLPVLQNAKVDFVRSELSFESENLQQAERKVKKLVKRLEPNAVLSGWQSEKSNQKIGHTKILQIALLCVGAAIFLVLLFVRSSLPAWAYWTLYVTSALAMGWQTYYKAVVLLFRGVINENLLITISVIGASVPAVSDHMEGLMVILLYSIGKVLEGFAVDKSRKSIASLVQSKPEFASVVTENGEAQLRCEDVQVGQVVVVRSGEKIPLDGVVQEGKCSLDMQSLTGESLPVFVETGREVLSGSVVLDGVLKICVSKPFKEGTIAKILNLVENASENKSKTETFISRITKWYTLGVVVLALAVFLIVWAVSGQALTGVYRGLTFLVISCPCAFAISVPLSYFAGLGRASKSGILVKGSNHLDTCARLQMVAFDKTGTLTTGKFSVREVVSFDENFSKEDVLRLCALGEKNSRHPLAEAITKSWQENVQKNGKIDSSNKGKELAAENVKEIAGEGVEFALNGKTYFVGRGGDEKESKKRKSKARKSEEEQNMLSEVCLFENGKLVGKILLSDTIKQSAEQTIVALKKMGVQTALLSGDRAEVANVVAKQLGVDFVQAECLPQDKYNFLMQCKNEGKKVAFVGDGLNDAPSLMLADLGISMGISGSDSSIEASDIVLMDDNPEKILEAIKISKKTRKIVWENIILSAAIKATFLILGAFGVVGMAWAVFADVGVTLLAILNSLRVLSK